MLQLLTLPFRIIGMVISAVFNFIGSIFGAIAGLFGAIVGMVGSVLGTILSLGFTCLVIIGIIAVVRWFVRGVRSAR